MGESSSSVELLEELASSTSAIDTAQYQKVYEKELKNWEEFKKNAPNHLQQKLEKYEKYAKQVDNTLCELMRNLAILFCVPAMILAKDTKLMNFPAGSVSVLRQFFDEETVDANASQNTLSVNREVPYTHYIVGLANVVEHILNMNLERDVCKYFEKLPYIEKVFISYFKTFRSLCFKRVEEYKRQVFENTDYFRSMKASNEMSQRKLRDLETEYKTVVEGFLVKKQAFYEKMDNVEYSERIEKELYEMQLHSIRLKNEPLIDKIVRSLPEDRTNRAQMAENIEDLYERTLKKDLKRCKTLGETRFKRQMAVVKMIEKFDRDFSVEYKRCEALNEQYQSLIKKSHELEDQISLLVKENYLILNIVETKKEALLKKIRVRHAIKIQRWWRVILDLRKVDTTSEVQSKSKSYVHRVQSSIRSRGITPQSSVRSTVKKTSKSHHSPSKRKAKFSGKPYINKIEDHELTRKDSTQSFPDPLHPASPDALAPEIDKKELVSIALKMKRRKSPRSGKGKGKSPRKDGK